MFDVAIVGGGPAGLMAAEVAARTGASVVVVERGRTPGRKFLLAGRSGLNLTHSEGLLGFIDRYGDSAERLRLMIEGFDPDALRAWSERLGEPTTVGSSGRVFPSSWRAAPLLRAWLQRLDALGVVLQTSTTWTGFVGDGPSITVDRAGEALVVSGRATVLACGGASWPRTGSDGSWMPTLHRAGVPSVPFRASNAELAVAWSTMMAKHVGEPIKDVVVTIDVDGRAPLQSRGDLVVVTTGIQGTPAYTIASAVGRAMGDPHQSARVSVDLRPDRSVDDLAARLRDRRPGESTANALRRLVRLSPAAIALANETQRAPSDPVDLAAHLKAIPLPAFGAGPIERAISSDGGLPWDVLDQQLRIRGLVNVFAAGEMIDWDAPTGGYLLQACFSTGAWAGHHAAAAAAAV